jgi:protein O-GlcNAc transferase
LDPDLTEANSYLVANLLQTCAWQELEGVSAKLDVLTEMALDSGTRPAEMPYTSVARHADPSLNFAVASSWSSDIAMSTSNLNIHFPFDDRRSSKTKIAVGYLSHDFRNHPVAHLILTLFGLHNRNEFEIFCYSYGPDDTSYYRRRIRHDCDRFVDLRDAGHGHAARCIHDDQIDILVDLTGYTEGNRLGICALRPAPIQVSYLGFPGTTGAEFFDYIITDRLVTSEEQADYYSENFVYMPHCFMVSDYTQAISERDWKKADLGLPEESFVFSSFNQAYKIAPSVFDVWMKVLRQVPESVLWVGQLNATAEKNLKRKAHEKGVSPERLVFAERVPSKDEHLARLRLADLALDTSIYNGHATTNDALWAGVPVITLKGSHFASRASASLLTAIGLPELITHSLEEYEALVVHLALDSDELGGIRQRLAKNRLAEPLFDTPRFARNLEKAYKEMWEIFLAGKKPRQIKVVENKTESL